MSFSRLKPAAVVAALSLLAPLSACEGLINKLMGTEVARLPINALSTPGNEVTREVSVELTKDEKLAIWSDMDMSYEGEAPMRFQLQVLKNGQQFQQMDIDPTEKNTSVKEVRTNINGRISWRFNGKNAELTIPENATYTFKARLVAAPTPSLQLRRAELVLRN